jgi:hypothetical protein
LPISREQSIANGKKGGRPVGSVTRLSHTITRTEAHRLVVEGKSPLHVMIRNMLFWDENATNIGEMIKAKLANIGEETDVRELTELLKKFMQAQAEAQKCAVDAAPYCHPRLANVAIKNDHSKNSSAPAVSMTLPHPDGEDREYRKVGESVGVVPEGEPLSAT